MEDLQKKLAKMSPQQKEEFMNQIRKKAIEDCIFCKILRGEIPARKVFENKKVLAFLDINPVNPGHTLVIPKKHYLLLTEIPDEELSELIKTVRNLSSIIFKVTNAEGITVTQNNGKSAGQIVPHVHFHIIPRFSGDKLENKWETMKLEDSQFQEIQDKINSLTTQLESETVSQIEEKKEVPEEESEPEKPKETPNFSPRIP